MSGSASSLLGLASIAVLVIACEPGRGGAGDPGAEGLNSMSQGVSDPPPDGPLPEIGPAPPGYRPTAAGAPSTDIWVGNLERQGTGLVITNLVNITDRAGYDNQPAFVVDGSALYYASAVDSTQTEIVRYSLATSRHEVVTHTSDVSEFSPTPIPGSRAVSAIHEQRGRQHLWRYGLDGEDLGPVFSTVEPVGYHAWVDARVVAMFVLGDSVNAATLWIGNTVTGELWAVADDPGRSLHRIPGGESLSFVQKVSPDEWWIERLDPISGESRRLVRTLPGREDYAWTPEGEVIMGEGATLFLWDGQGTWTELQDLAQVGVGEISRLSVSADGRRIAVVSTRLEGTE